MKLSIVTAPARNSKHWQQSEIEWQDVLRWVDSPSGRKDCGNYLFGKLRGTVRSNTTVVSRSALTLDVDHPSTDFIDDFLMVANFAFLAHTTYSASPSEPRYRLIVPLDREVTPDEYTAAAREFMARYGAEQFDISCSRPAQYMFRPGAQNKDWFRFWVGEGQPESADSLLTDFIDDLSVLPAPKLSRTKRNPFELGGVVGAFNRAYEDFQLLIDTYDLPYEPDGDRWHLADARSVAGMGKIADGLVYSHHSHDPAFGIACSAFDLVRLHKFGELDEGTSPQTPVNRRKSHEAMLDEATLDARVTAEIVGVDFNFVPDDLLDDIGKERKADPSQPPAVSPDDPNAWKLGLRLRARTGEFMDCVQNWDLVVKHDPVFQLLYYNDMTMAVEISGDLPWRGIEKGEIFSTIDRQALVFYLEREYGFRPYIATVEALVNTKAQQRWVNPVRDYLDNLPVWDGKPRVETCLPGVAPTPYTKMVARKSLVAAVARTYKPGIKWDHTLVLFGDEGLGKTFWVQKVTRGWMATLSRITDKDTLIVMHRSWIMLADEGYSLRKADADVQKEFLTRTEDIFRMPYDREALLHRRRCVFWSTTNDEIFLRDQKGNRRYLIVHCEDKVDFDKITDDYVDQLWAEAVHLYQNGEVLFLEDRESLMARDAREQFTEEDNLTGLIQEFLDTKVPEDWDQMSPESRRMWIMSSADGVAKGTVRQERTCSTQIWVEMMGNPVGKRDRNGLLEITNTLKKMPEWTLLRGRHRLPNYGPQAVFVRTDTLGTDLL